MGKKIMLVDDDADERLLFVEAMLEIAPVFECVTRNDSKKTLFELLQQSMDEHPDLIFVDINMPCIDGWEFLRRVKSDHATQHIPIIMYSTSSMPGDSEKAKEAGALGLYTKADDFIAMKDSLQHILENIGSRSIGAFHN